MTNYSLDDIKLSLGVWDNKSQIEFLNLQLEDDIILQSGSYKLFPRPRGFQLSLDNGINNYILNYSAINEIILSRKIYTIETKKSWIIFSLFFGFLFFITGLVLSDFNLGLIWLPSGLVFGFLLSNRLKKVIKRKKVCINIESNRSLIFYLDYLQETKANIFFNDYLKTKFKIE